MKYYFSIKETVLKVVFILRERVRLQLKMKWFSVLALCVALFIAATHASHFQDEAELINEADEEKLLQMLLADQSNAENDEKIELADEETAVIYKGRISSARDKANVQCECHCGGWQKASKAQGNARAQCRCCGGWLI